MVQDDEDKNANSLDKNMAVLGDCFPSLGSVGNDVTHWTKLVIAYTNSVYFTGKTAGHS